MAPSGIESATFRFVAQHTWTGTEEYCRAGAMGGVTGVISCTALGKKQQNLLCWLSTGTDRSCLLDFQIKSAMSVLGNKYWYWSLSLHNQTQTLTWFTKIYKDSS